MFDYTIDWRDIKGAYAFQDLVKSYIFMTELLSVGSLVGCSRDNIFNGEGHNDAVGTFVFRAFYIDLSLSIEQRREKLQSKLDQEIGQTLHNPKINQVKLYLNSELPPGSLTSDDRILLITAPEMENRILEGGWSLLFRKHFKGAIPIASPEQYPYLSEFASSLPDSVQHLGIGECRNLMSWVQDLGYYKPTEVLEFCQTLWRVDKATETKQHPVFGEDQLLRKDYLEKIPNLLHGVAAHEKFFKESLDLLLRISIELNPPSAFSVGHLPQYVDDVVGYFYGRDFVAEGEKAIYNPTFNNLSLDAIQQYLDGTDEAMAIRGLWVLASLLETKVEATSWEAHAAFVRWTTYNLPLQDERLLAVRTRAVDLIFGFYQSSDRSTRVRLECIRVLRDSLQYITKSHGEGYFRRVLEFVRTNQESASASIAAKMVGLLELLRRHGSEEEASQASELIQTIQSRSDVKIFSVLFSSRDWFDDSNLVDELVNNAIASIGATPQGLLDRLQELVSEHGKPSNGMRWFLFGVGRTYTKLSEEVIREICNGDSVDRLSPDLIKFIGYLVAGLRLSDAESWKRAIRNLQSTGGSHHRSIALTGFQIASYDGFTKEDLELLCELSSDQEESIKLLACEALWYFDKYPNYIELLRAYKDLVSTPSTAICGAVFMGITRETRKPGFESKFETTEAVSLLSEIVFSVKDFDDLESGTMELYNLELLLRALWRSDIAHVLDFFKYRIISIPNRGNDYKALPYSLSTLFEGISDEQQFVFVRSVFEWELEEYGYQISHLLGKACSRGLCSSTRDYLSQIAATGSEFHRLVVAELLSDLPLNDDFYSLALILVEGTDQKSDIENQVFGSVISTTGGSRVVGTPFPSLVKHNQLCEKFLKESSGRERVEAFLKRIRDYVQAHLKRDEEEDNER